MISSFIYPWRFNKRGVWLSGTGKKWRKKTPSETVLSNKGGTLMVFNGQQIVVANTSVMSNNEIAAAVLEMIGIRIHN